MPCEHGGLAPAERTILRLILAGNTTAEIALYLLSTEALVDEHCRRLMEKLGARNRVQLLKLALRYGLGG